MQPQTRYARSPEGRVAYQIIGDRPLDLVFIPYWSTNIDVMWEEPSLARFLGRLASFSRLLCFDKRGTGVSDPLPLGSLPTLEQWMDDVRVIMDAAGSKRATLFGHGEAGQTAILFAATYPEQTSALILVDSSARALRDVGYPCGLPADRVAVAVDRFEERWGTGENLDFIAPSVAHDERFKRWYARYERLAVAPRTASAIYAMQFERDLRDVLKAIRVPTLVMHRVGNRYIRVGNGRYMAEHIPGAKWVELPGEDYLFHVGETEIMLAETEEFLTGMRSAPELDRVLATVLFTDIVGSTEKAAEIGDRKWRELLDQHDAIVGRQLQQFRGRLVRSTGDGILATFDGPARAIRCAGAIRDGLRGLGIGIRAGLHTGEVEMRADDLGGIAVHIGARVAALAAAGEILISSTVKDLVVGSGILFADRGTHILKGVPGEWRVFAAE
jgi:class 3 adenylate cyclase